VKRLKKILLGGFVVLVMLALLFVGLAGPWPVYEDSNFEEADYYANALSDLDASAAQSDLNPAPGALRAGWASRVMTPAVGTPLGGYGDRNGAPSTGVRDDLHVKAIALNDGVDTVVLVGADMLLIPPTVTAHVIKAVQEKTPLTENQILYHASHTHCGPGAFAEGFAAKVSGGEYNPQVVKQIAVAFSEAIIEAYESMGPAQLGHGKTDASPYIRNRTREGEVDGVLHVALVKQDDGDACYVTRFSAHPTIFGGSMLKFSAEYPGVLMEHIEKETNATAIYLGGALGSMSTSTPPQKGKLSKEERLELIGTGLAQLVLEVAPALSFTSQVDIASLSVPIRMPAAQVRPVSPKWRLSPVLAGKVAMNREAHIQGARIGNMLLIGTSFDFSGELSREWQAWAYLQDLQLWPTSFAPGYAGYLTPDRYYYDLEDDGNLDYETGLMSWYGPNAEAYITALMKHAVAALGTAS
jgi:neutral ceramidase